MTAKVAKPYIGMGMDGFIARWYAGITRKNMPDYIKDARKLAAMLAPGSAVLDLAPGPGYLSIELAKLGSYRITGLDISATFVEIAGANARDAGVAVDYRQGDAAHMPFEDGSFDLLVCRAAFKNFSDPVAALNEMRRVLKTGGKAVILDLRGDASSEDINTAVAAMGLSAFNAFMTRFIFKHSLIKRAYTEAKFSALVAKSTFDKCQMLEDSLSLEVYLEK